MKTFHLWKMLLALVRCHLGAEVRATGPQRTAPSGTATDAAGNTNVGFDAVLSTVRRWCDGNRQRDPVKIDPRCSRSQNKCLDRYLNLTWYQNDISLET